MEGAWLHHLLIKIHHTVSILGEGILWANESISQLISGVIQPGLPLDYKLVLLVVGKLFNLKLRILVNLRCRYELIRVVLR